MTSEEWGQHETGDEEQLPRPVRGSGGGRNVEGTAGFDAG